MPGETPLTKEEWLLRFRTEAGQLRGLYLSKMIAAVALQESVRHGGEDPVKVAQIGGKRQGPAKR